MSETQEPEPEPLSLEEAVRAAQELARRAEAAAVGAGFLELVQRWAAPSAVLTAVRDVGAPAGWRLLPALCAGSLTLGIEKTLAKLVADTPECLERPTLLRGEEVPGVRVRDNVVVPWWLEQETGVVVLRGVPRPVRSGLGEAIALAGASVWPRLIGSPASRMEAVLRELQAGAARIESEVARQVERLQAATPAAAPGADAALQGRVGELEGELETALRAIDSARRDLEAARRERETSGVDLAAARQQAENARRELESAREEQRAAELALDAARRELESARASAAQPAAAAKGGGEPPASPGAPPAAAALTGGDATSAALTVAITAARRAAFVPPLLRVSIEDVARLASPDARPERRLAMALLDRDVVALEPVAAELEASGIEVRLAQQPEELALLLRSPDASSIDAIVCDVMSFRPDQNVAGLLRGWDKDRPGLVSYLSYDAQSPSELERARRTPMSLTAGHIQRPLTAARLGETLENLAKRLGR